MKEIDPSKAASWSEEEFEYNVTYLETRLRWAEADACREARESKKSRRAAKVVEDDEEDDG